MHSSITQLLGGIRCGWLQMCWNCNQLYRDQSKVEVLLVQLWILAKKLRADGNHELAVTVEGHAAKLRVLSRRPHDPRILGFLQEVFKHRSSQVTPLTITPPHPPSLPFVVSLPHRLSHPLAPSVVCMCMGLGHTGFGRSSRWSWRGRGRNRDGYCWGCSL